MAEYSVEYTLKQYHKRIFKQVASKGREIEDLSVLEDLNVLRALKTSHQWRKKADVDSIQAMLARIDRVESYLNGVSVRSKPEVPREKLKPPINHPELKSAEITVFTSTDRKLGFYSDHGTRIDVPLFTSYKKALQNGITNLATLHEYAISEDEAEPIAKLDRAKARQYSRSEAGVVEYPGPKHNRPQASGPYSRSIDCPDRIGPQSEVLIFVGAQNVGERKKSMFNASIELAVSMQEKGARVHIVQTPNLSQVKQALTAFEQRIVRDGKTNGTVIIAGHGSFQRVKGSHTNSWALNYDGHIQMRISPRTGGTKFALEEDFVIPELRDMQSRTGANIYAVVQGCHSGAFLATSKIGINKS